MNGLGIAALPCLFGLSKLRVRFVYQSIHTTPQNLVCRLPCRTTIDEVPQVLVIRKIMSDTIPCFAIRPVALTSITLVISAVGCVRQIENLSIRLPPNNCDFCFLDPLTHV